MLFQLRMGGYYHSMVFFLPLRRWPVHSFSKASLASMQHDNGRLTPTGTKGFEDVYVLELLVALICILVETRLYPLGIDMYLYLNVLV
jgi:hypothetical protein